MGIPFKLWEAVDHLKWLTDFAYTQGAHELGYDPLQVVIDALAEQAHSKTTSEPCASATGLALDATDPYLIALTELESRACGRPQCNCWIKVIETMRAERARKPQL